MRNKDCPIGKELKKFLEDGKGMAISRARRGSYIFLRSIDSRSDACRRIIECLNTDSCPGLVSVDVNSEGPGVFEDCTECDNQLNRFLITLIDPDTPENMRNWEAGGRFRLSVKQIVALDRLLSSPPRPDCGSERCAVTRPGISGEYVATVVLAFHDANILIRYYATYNWFRAVLEVSVARTEMMSKY